MFSQRVQPLRPLVWGYTLHHGDCRHSAVGMVFAKLVGTSLRPGPECISTNGCVFGRQCGDLVGEVIAWCSSWNRAAQSEGRHLTLDTDLCVKYVALMSERLPAFDTGCKRIDSDSMVQKTQQYCGSGATLRTGSEGYVVGPPGFEPGTKGFACSTCFQMARTISSPATCVARVRDALACYQGRLKPSGSLCTFRRCTAGLAQDCRRPNRCGFPEFIPFPSVTYAAAAPFDESSALTVELWARVINGKGSQHHLPVVKWIMNIYIWGN